MTSQGFEAALIVTDTRSSGADFDVSSQTLITLINAGVSNSVLEAMLAAQALCRSNSGWPLKEGVQIPVKFAAGLNLEPAHEGDPVEFLPDDDLRIETSILVPKGAHAAATVTEAKNAGRLGRPGEPRVQMQYPV
jgi:hypothetical protein